MTDETIAERYGDVPEVLRNRPQWVCWRREQRDGRATKVPYSVKTGRRASSTDPETWSTYEDALHTVNGYDGLGFVLSEDDPFVFIDLDHVLRGNDDIRFVDGERGEMAKRVLSSVDSYAEVSPSGDGVHIIARASKPEGIGSKNDALGFECYDHARFATVTGRVYRGRNRVHGAQKGVDEVCGHYLAKKAERPAQAVSEPYSGTLSVDEVTERIRASRDGARFDALMRGDLSGQAGNHSGADLALCNILAFWCDGDAALMDAIFRTSGLMRGKWDSARPNGTYGSWTIGKALADTAGRYDWGRAKAREAARPGTAYAWDDVVAVSDCPEDGGGAVPVEAYETGADVPQHRPPEDGHATDEEAGRAEGTTWTPQSVGAYLEGGWASELRRERATEPLKTGFYNLDGKCDGLYPGLYVLGAISSLGKTTFALQVADNIAAAGHDVLFFSLEQSRLELVSKLVARRTRDLSVTQASTSLMVRRGTETDKGVSRDAQADLAAGAAKHLFIEQCDMGTTVVDVCGKVQAAYDAGMRPAVFVDYLQVLAPTDPRATDKQAADYNVKMLKLLQARLGLVVFTISSVNRANYLAPINFESFKETGGIEYTADVVWGLQLSCLDEDIFVSAKDTSEGRRARRDRVDECKAASERDVKLVCLKNRYGRSHYEARFSYLPAFDRFEQAGA